MAHLTGTQGGTPRRRVRLLVTSLAFVAISAAVLAVASPALAQTPTFTDVTVFGGDQLDLNVSFTEVGLQPSQSVDYTLTANATWIVTCDTPRGRPTGKRAVLANLPQSDSLTFSADSSGTVTGLFNYIFDFGGANPGPSCPGHLQFGPPECVIYDTIVLTDTTNNVSHPIAGTIASPDQVGGRC